MSTKDIFAEMNAESMSMKAVNLNNLQQKKPKSPKKKKSTSKKSVMKEVGLSSLSINLPTDEANKPAASVANPSTQLQNDNMVEDIMGLCREASNKDALATVLAAGGDSDDDDTDDEEAQEGGEEGEDNEETDNNPKAMPPPPPSTQTGERRWTIDRFNSALNAESKQTRLEALTALHTVLINLSSSMPKLRELDLPPPYDPSRIVLTHKQGAMVSDMASGEYAPHWAAWQKTRSGLMSQFLEDKTNEPLQPPKPEGGERGEDDVDENELGDSVGELSSVANLARENEFRRQLQFLLDGTANALFKRFSDSAEKCRHLSILSTEILILYAPDVSKHIPYLLPAILSRYPPTFFDQDTNVFIHDLEGHEGYKRGVATARQDKTSLVHNSSKVTVVEPSEEVRLMLCNLISALLKSGVGYGSLQHLNPYFSDLVLILQSQLRDPFPQLKCTAALLLVNVVRIPQWEQGAAMFATAIARASITNLRSRNAKVRVASLSLFEAAAGIPNRAKVRGAGTDAIQDLVGFREENVLPIAAFYNAEAGVSVNALAEICQDNNGTVRARACAMLCFFITCLPDRYDHHTRLLPYVLSFFNDDRESTRKMALQAIEHCGGQYEAEHPDDVIERRQYGIDGDSRTNVDAKLPFPFVDRPRLGARLFIRGNTKRFFKALLKELTNWIDTTRERSANLLLILAVYCEEHLTMDFHATLPLCVKALRNSINDGKTSKELTEHMKTVLEVMGRFVDPETYVPLLLPRVTGEGDGTSSAEGGVHSEESRRVNAVALGSLMRGSLTRQLTAHVKAIVLGICGECLTSDVSVMSRICFLETLNVLLVKIRGNQGKVLTGYFNATGRLADLDSIWTAVCKSLLFCQNNVEGSASLTELSKAGLETLKGGESMNTNNVGLKQWAGKIHNHSIAEIMEEGHAMWEADGEEVRVLDMLWKDEEARSGLETGVGDLVMLGDWIMEGIEGEDFESVEAGVECFAGWCGMMSRSLSFVVDSVVKRASFVDESCGVFLGAVLKGGEEGVGCVRALFECLRKAGKRELGVWNVGVEWGEQLAAFAVKVGDFEFAAEVLDFTGSCVWGPAGFRLASFAKMRRAKVDRVIASTVWSVLETGVEGYLESGLEEKKAFGSLCNSMVYHLVEDGKEGGDVDDDEEPTVEEVPKEKKEGKKEKTKLKLQRVSIEFSDSESDDEEELSESMKKLAQEGGKRMAAKRFDVGLKRVEILDEDEVEEVEVEGGKKGEAEAGDVTLERFLKLLLPIGASQWLKNGVDKLDEEEFEAAAVFDGALRLAAVLEPKEFIERCKEEGKKVNCNFFNGVIEHGELLVMLGGGGPR
ncbi:hypothetical protein TL16_g02727 [Triparma laevis f. inornata]|uniref:Uncharacterized protein n=1 Tax=Triparma laevis f. inornata TaxID=1714386 RepID=A0A9W6ZT37_9STRA|nr:hypothetical protein TL16_g02727 [Triparma laevis f. inornata]